MRRYVEPLREATCLREALRRRQGTKLADCFSILLKKAVGFRNIAVHHYEEIDWAIVHGIALNHLNDFSEFAKVIAARLPR